MTDTFMFFRSYYNAIAKIKRPTIRLQAYEMIIDYALNDKQPTTDNEVLLTLFEMVKPLIKNTDKRKITSVINGQKSKGAPKGNQNASKDKNNLNNLKNNLPYQDIYIKDINQDINQEKIKEEEKDISISSMDIDIDKEREKEIGIGCLLSREDIKNFKSLYPTKAIEEDTLVPIQFNMQLLLDAIKESDFLTNSDNLSFKWLVDNYDRVLKGEFKNYTKQGKSRTWDSMRTLFEGE